jgi:hypothetical protein
MFYTICVLITGVYFTQEYPEFIPSIKSLVKTAYIKFTTEQVIQPSIFESFSIYITKFFKQT